MALDYIRWQVPTEDAHHLLEKYSDKVGFEVKGGVIKEFPKKITVLQDLMKVEIKGKKKTVIGFSPHKLYNYLTGKGNQNYTSIKLSQCFTAINQACEMLEIDLWQYKINQLEYGANLCVPFSSVDFLNESPLLHKWEGFEIDKKRGKGYLIRSSYLCDYEIKFYSKDKQYGKSITKDNILRFEVKFQKPSRILKSSGVLIGKMLKDPFTISTLEKSVLKRFEEVVFVNPYLAVKKLEGNDLEAYLRFSSKGYLEKLKPDKTLLDKKEYDKLRKRALRSKQYLTKLNKRIGFQKQIDALQETLKKYLEIARSGLQSALNAA